MFLVIILLKIDREEATKNPIWERWKSLPLYHSGSKFYNGWAVIEKFRGECRSWLPRTERLTRHSRPTQEEPGREQAACSSRSWKVPLICLGAFLQATWNPESGGWRPAGGSSIEQRSLLVGWSTEECAFLLQVHWWIQWLIHSPRLIVDKNMQSANKIRDLLRKRPDPMPP